MNSSEQPCSTYDSHNVHVVDDDEGFRTGITRLLNASGLRAVAYESADDYLRANSGDLPGCVVLDLAMPGKGGMEMFAELAGHEHVPPVIFLTAHGDIPTGVQAIRSGAVDFLLKPVTKDQLLESVGRAIAMDIGQRNNRARLETIRRRYQSLSEREQQVFQGMVEGKLNKQLAPVIGVCERTVKALRAQVMTKMHANSLPELVEAADVLGLV